MRTPGNFNYQADAYEYHVRIIHITGIKSSNHEPSVARSLIQARNLARISKSRQRMKIFFTAFYRYSGFTRVNVQLRLGSEDTIGRRRVSAPNVAISSNVLSRNNRRASSLITADTHVTAARRDYWNASTIHKGTSTRLGVSPERASARDCSLAEPRPRVCHEIADYHRSRKPPTLRRLLALVYQPSRPLLTYLCHGLLASEKLLSTGADRSIQFQFSRRPPILSPITASSTLHPHR